MVSWSYLLKYSQNDTILVSLAFWLIQAETHGHARWALMIYSNKNLTFVIFHYNGYVTILKKIDTYFLKQQTMDVKKAGMALGLSASVAGGASAEQGTSFNDWALNNPEQASQILAKNDSVPQEELAQSIIETGELTKSQIEEIQLELTQKNKFRYDVKGANDYLQGDASFTHKNLGLGIQVIDSQNVNQFSLTGGIGLSLSENHALSKVVQNGQIKVSLVESEVKNAIADFDETGIGIEFILNLKNALFKQATISHSNHGINITDGSDKFRVFGVDTQTNITSRTSGNQVIETTTTDVTTNEARNVSQDVSQTGVQVLLGLSDDLDVVLGYAKDSLGKSLTSAELEYKLNENWSLNLEHEQTRRFSGAEAQDINSATVHYRKGKWSAYVGLRDNGFDTSPYAGIQYKTHFGDHLTSSRSTKKFSNIGSDLTSPVRTAQELHPHAISQETRSTTQTTVTEKIDNLATGGLSNIQTTVDSCSADFNVSDADGVDSVIVRLSNGDEQEFSTANGTATFTGLADNTSFGIELIGVTRDGITGATSQRSLGTAQCRTQEVQPEPEEPETPEPTPESPTTVSSISGDATISVGDTPTYSITADDVDGIATVTATVDGVTVSVAQSGNQYSIVLPSSATASAGSVSIEFSVTGTRADGGNDATIVRTQSIDVEPVISSPAINPIGSWDIQDNGGGLPSTFQITGSDIQAGATFTLLTPVLGLSINSNTGELIFDQNIFGNQSFTITVEVTNPDTGNDTETFTLNVNDNF